MSMAYALDIEVFGVADVKVEVEVDVEVNVKVELKWK